MEVITLEKKINHTPEMVVDIEMRIPMNLCSVFTGTKWEVVKDSVTYSIYDLGGNFDPDSDVLPHIPRLLSESYMYSHKSQDPSTQLGAILVDSETFETISWGWNRFPNGILSSDERYNNRDTKYKLITHAERACCYNAAANGIKTHDSMLICPWFSCSECAKTILDCGIKTIIGHYDMLQFAMYQQQETVKNGGHDWITSINLSYNMFREANINFFLYKGSVGISSPIKVGGIDFYA